MTASRLHIKRVYDPPAHDDGLRVLIDRLWPRGLSKAEFHYDLWPKDLTPSAPLRQWFHRDPSQFAEFRKRYRAELSEHEAELKELKEAMRGRTVTLLTAAKEPEHSHAVVLRDALASKH